MARARNIKPGFFRNADLVELPFETRLLFIGLWTLADREGRLEDRHKQIKMELFPVDNIDVDSMLEELQSRKFLIRYEAEQHKYIEITNFIKHQDPHYKEVASVIPPRVGTENFIKATGITRAQRARILDRDAHKCKKCSSDEHLCIDHIMPVSRGGDSSDGNLQVLCIGCNTRKGNKIDDETKNKWQRRINAEPASDQQQPNVESTSSQRRVNVGSVSVQQKCSLPSDSLIPDSLIPDSLILNPEGNLGGDSVCCSTLSDLPTSAAKAPPAASRTPRGQRLPQDWALPKAWGDEAMAEFSGWTVEKVRLEAAKFRDHWVAKAGKDAVKMDWNATWRNWCRSDIAHRDDVKPFRNGHHVSGGHNGHGPKTPEQIALRNAEAMRLLGITLPPPKPPLEYVDA